MSDLLSIGATGVRAYQSALTTVSENIANAGNAGYSRRAIALTEISTVAGITSTGGVNGNGVAIAGLTRSADMFRSAAVRSAGADLARTEVGSVWLDQIQTGLTGNDLGGRLTSFFNAARTLAADPGSTAARAVMLESAITVASGFTATGKALAQAASDLDVTANQATASLGALGTALAKVNGALGRAGAGTSAVASLSDQRDRILEEMSALVDVSANFDAAGRATVRVGGAAGPVLVAGTETGSVSYARNDEGMVAFTVSRAGTAETISPSGGALAGVVDSAQRIAVARSDLDTMATGFVDGINAVQAQGRDGNGNPGAAIFAAGSSPTEISVVMTDPSGIAAASPGEGGGGNGNLAAFATLRTTGGFEAKLTTMVATNAATIQQRQTVADAQGAIRDGAVTARDAVSGVDLDSEAVDLLRFQQAYQASSRIIQVARETLQSILDIR